MRILGLIVALSLLLYACGDDDGENDASSGSNGGENAEVCSAVSDVESAVTAVQDLDSGSSLDDVQQALDGILQAGEELANAIRAAPGVDLSGLESSVRDLVDALEAIPAADSVQAGLAEVDRAADSVVTEAQEAGDSVADAGCP